LFYAYVMSLGARALEKGTKMLFDRGSNVKVSVVILQGHYHVFVGKLGVIVPFELVVVPALCDTICLATNFQKGTAKGRIVSWLWFH
jgi:hypothetical protein